MCNIIPRQCGLSKSVQFNEEKLGAEREPGPSRFRLPFTPSNSSKFGPVAVVGGFAFSASDCLELCASYCGWKILLQSIEHLGRQRA